MSRHEGELDALIRGAREERPRGRRQAQRKLFVRLGLGGSAMMELARASAAFASVMKVRSSALGAAGLALGAAGVMASAFATRVEGDEEPPVPVRVAEPSTNVSAPLTTVDEPSIPTVSVEALPTAPRVRPPTTRSANTAPAGRADGDDLAKEAASISNLRSKLDAQDFVGTLEGVRTHRASFPHGLLAQEVVVLEIEAHHGLRHERTTCALGRSFLDAHPTSAHRARVSELVRTCPR